MHPTLYKTFGGLTPQYYLRQLFFGALLAAFILFMTTHGVHPIKIGVLFFIVINTLLYPYSRFIYESFISFIVGENMFFVNAIFMLITKLFTIAMCWALAIFIAPIGLAYLYFHHTRTQN
jgi:hypothetical protein